MNALWTLPVDGLPFTALDRAFVAFLQSVQVTDDARHAWLAALASHQHGRGHACLDLTALQQDAQGVLGWSDEQLALLPPDLAAAAATLPWTRDAHAPLVLTETAGVQRLYLRRSVNAEQRILQSLQQRLALSVPPTSSLAALLQQLFAAGATTLGTDLQRRACEVAAQGLFTLITGGPGTGKTTTVTRLLALLVHLAQQAGAPAPRIKLAAPTGKAASRLTQSIGRSAAALPAGFALDVAALQATTLHGLLGLRGDERDRELRIVDADIVVVDEASMVDLELMARLFAAVPATTRLVLLGDKDQLASVEAGAVLAQLCQRPALQSRIVTLTHSHRFRADSGIGQWAAAVNSGDARLVQSLCEAAPAWRAGADAPVQRLALRQAREPQLLQCIREGWSAWLQGLRQLDGQHCSDDQAIELLNQLGRFQVLCALRSGLWGVQMLNPQIQHGLGLGNALWFAGRPVMVTRNDTALRLMNGDVGLCLPRDGMLRVAFIDSEGGLRWISPARLESVETVFAMTVHKSQGSEFGRVLLVLPDQPSPVLTRELLYTGITRAKEGMVLLAPKLSVLTQAVQRQVQRAGGLVDG